MDGKREEFLARLRETFRTEASEHLDAISAGLLAVERAGEPERSSIVERVFREAHSLKGAARAVNLPGVAALCQGLESVFAAARDEGLALSTPILDIVHSGLDALSGSCGDPDGLPSPESRARERVALKSLERIVRAAADGGTEAVSTKDEAPDGPCPSTPRALVERETVRVSTAKLDAILLASEELLGAKIAADDLAAELGALAADLSAWNRRRPCPSTRRPERQEGAPEPFEPGATRARALENSLRKMAASARRDALAFATIAERLFEDTKKLLLLPCSYLLGGLPRIARDLAREQGKEADLLVNGEDIEIDRRVLDELKDPLIHIVRNCVDHGIEKPEARIELGKPARGTITIVAKAAAENRVELSVSDDGAGIRADKVGEAALRRGLISAAEAVGLTDAEAAGLVFRSGLSTSPIVSDISGRGLGLAIVKEKVERLGGTVTLSSASGAGATFRVLVPISLATFHGVLVEVADRRFLFPTSGVLRVYRIRPGEIGSIQNRRAITIDGVVVAVASLRDALELARPEKDVDSFPSQAVVVRDADRRVAFLVDDVIGEQEVMVKSLGPQLARVRNIAGASISADGAVVPILDVADLVETAIAAGTPEPIGAVRDAAPESRRRVLVAEDSITARTLVKNVLMAAGYDVATAVDGMDALTALKTGPFDLLVSDVDMPRMNGFELTSSVRADKRLAELPVVLVTALGSRKDREYGIEVGANAYIVKSDFDQGDLLETVRRLL